MAKYCGCISDPYFQIGTSAGIIGPHKGDLLFKNRSVNMVQFEGIFMASLDSNLVNESLTCQKYGFRIKSCIYVFCVLQISKSAH